MASGEAALAGDVEVGGVLLDAQKREALGQGGQGGRAGAQEQVSPLSGGRGGPKTAEITQ